MEAAGFTVDDVTKLRSFPELAALKRVLNGSSKIVVVKHIINCDAAPFVPEGWKVESHKNLGQLEWDPTKIRLWLSNGQQDGSVEGNNLHKELASEPVLNANVLDYLLAHPKLIPEEWKGKAVFFWGTIYRRSDGSLPRLVWQALGLALQLARPRLLRRSPRGLLASIFLELCSENLRPCP